MNNEQSGYALFFMLSALLAMMSNVMYASCVFDNCTSLDSELMRVDSVNTTECKGRRKDFDIGFKPMDDEDKIYVVELTCYRVYCSKSAAEKYQPGKIVKVYMKNEDKISLRNVHNPKNNEWYVIFILTMWPFTLSFLIFCCSSIAFAGEKTYRSSIQHDRL